ncbi:TMV resistance protein N-like [Gossypium australe]|uniref:TMV resistance protein N-like n=1 Tax=Gossypium australe TaxID=47621 RepID=A0A5B6WGP4_9ROSI|nr:TMV resistance protein N-like [Gossypium australe]
MKDSETIKQYSDRIMVIVNSIRLLGDELSNKRIVEKDSRDLSTISLPEMINALYAQEQMRTNRQEEHSKGAFQAKSKEIARSSNSKGKNNWNGKRKKPRRYKDSVRDGGNKKSCKQLGHTERFCKNKRKQQQQMCKLKLLMGIKLRRS